MVESKACLRLMATIKADCLPRWIGKDLLRAGYSDGMMAGT